MPRERAEAELKQMLRTMRHEPFYETGTWSDESAGVYLGWTARPGAVADGKPMCNERTGVTLAFSGEEFPEPGTAGRLGRAVPSRGADPARAYLLALQEQDPSFPAGLNGRFHGLVVDRPRQTATLFNDRFGMHRLYYHEAADGFYFAAEAKAILAVRPETRTADPRGLGELVSNGCVLENRTLFQGIHVLPIGSAWVFRGGAAADKRAYFEPREWEDQPVLDPEAYYRDVREVFTRNLPRYFETADRLGFSLTGGLDTRMILAWHNPPRGTLPTYTFGGMFRDCHDVRVGREVAQACGQPHQVIPVGGEFLAEFGDLAARTVYMTDGCADVSRTADLYVNQRARAIAPVRMTGNYGGEVLRRVRAFKPMAPVDGLFQPAFTPHIDRARETYGTLLREHPLSFAVFKQAPWHHFGLLALEQTQMSTRSPFLDNDFVRTVFRAPAAACTTDEVCLRLIADGSPALSRIATDRGIGANGGGGRVSRALLEFSFKAEYAYDYGMPQWLARADHLLRPLRLERQFLGRHKFYHYRVWYRDQLSKWVQSVLLDPAALKRPYLNAAAVERIVGAHVTGRGNYTTAIHKLVTLELAHRLLLGER
jgi:asparagine synthase (glutamine-hydrolysing)